MLKYLILLLALIGLLWASGAWAAGSPGTLPVSEGERQSLVVGMVMGIDVAGAYEGIRPLTRDEWNNFAQIFNEVTRGCTTTGCITDRVVALRLSLMKANQSPKVPIGPSVPQIEKELM